MKLAVILFLLLLTSCGPQKDPRDTQGFGDAKASNQPSKPIFQQVDGNDGSTKCIDGASYELKYGGAFLQFKDGKYVTC